MDIKDFIAVSYELLIQESSSSHRQFSFLALHMCVVQNPSKAELYSLLNCIHTKKCISA